MTYRDRQLLRLFLSLLVVAVTLGGGYFAVKDRSIDLVFATLAFLIGSFIVFVLEASKDRADK